MNANDQSENEFRPGVLKPDPEPAQHAFQIVPEGVLKFVPVFRPRVAEKKSYLVAICSDRYYAKNLPLFLNPFSWSMVQIDLFPPNGSDALHDDALIEALRGEHDLRDGFYRFAAVKEKGSPDTAAAFFSFNSENAGWTLKRILTAEGAK